MVCTSGEAATFEELIEKIVAYVTDASLHGDEVWELMRKEPWPRGTILKAPGRRDGEYLYIGLMNNKYYRGSTYAAWLYQPKNLATYFAWHPTGLGRNGRPYSGGGGRVLFQGEKNAYYFSPAPDIFACDSQALHFGVFKQYAEELDWHEQGGAVDFDALGPPMLAVQYQVEGYDDKSDFVPPLLPGVGYPAIGMDIGGPVDGTLKYWLVKARSYLIVAMQNREYYDSAYAGFFEPYDNEEYAFPAAVIGGTSGLTAVGKDVKHRPGQVTPDAMVGLQADYRPRNWSLVHAIAPYAAVGFGREKCPSQVMAMLPDGQWRFFANYVQSIQAVPEHVCHSQVKRHYYLRPEPALYNGSYRIRPTERGAEDLVNSYGKAETDLTPKEREIRHFLLPLELLECKEERRNLLGRLPGFFYPTAPVASYGPLELEGKKYLATPNVFAQRRFHYKGHAGIVYDVNPDKLLEDDETMLRRSRAMQQMIRLE